MAQPATDTILGLGAAPSCPGCGSPASPAGTCAVCGVQTPRTLVEAAPASGSQAVERVLADPSFTRRFEISRKLGQGAYSAIYAARDRHADRAVALKILLDPTPNDIARAEREGLLLSRLDHPNIIRVYGVEPIAGTVVLGLELLEGQTLAVHLERIGRYSPTQAIAMMQMILAGLSAGHAAGAIHRDVKPENVLLLSDGQAKLLDFGLARDTGSGGAMAHLTATGIMLGTPAYLAPELIQGQKAESTADVYSAGVVLYQLLAGQVPFTGAGLVDILSKHLTQSPPPLTDELPDLPSQLVAVVEKALAKHPSGRYQTAQAMSDDLAKVPESVRAPQMKVKASGAIKQPSKAEVLTVESHPSLNSAPTNTPAAARSTLPPFSQAFLSQFEFVRPLGEGGMGVVYLMRQVKLDRLVAVKVVRPEAFTGEERQRLMREARVLASLNHANILAIHDVGQDGELPYMVCEFVEGETLRSRLASKTPLSLISALRIGLQMLDGLQTAHKAGVNHRDLKPDNVLLTREGKPKIADFGLARSEKAPPGASIGKIAGTPAYMSPEQARGHDTTAASDLYSTGVILFQMTVGALPFPGPEIMDFLIQHTTQQAPLARSMKPDLPEGLEKILARALEKDPKKRFSSAAEFMKALLDLYKNLTSGATSTPGKASRPISVGGLAPGVLLAQRYELVRVVGQGGMGQVWLAKDTALEGTQVAVKLLPAELWSDQHARATVIQEAKLSLKLSHPNILRVVNLEPGDPPFLVMEYLEGSTLADELSRRKLVNEGSFSVQEALPLIEALAGALDHAHALDILHRDVKPSNILLVPSGTGSFTPKLADFGIAAELKRLKAKPGSAPTGTIAYMSPEQLTSQKLDLRADVYSLAATAYQMLTLDMPGEPGRIAIPENIPKFVADVLQRGLAADRDARPGTAGSLAKDLKMAVLRHEMLSTAREPRESQASIQSLPVPRTERPDGRQVRGESTTPAQGRPDGHSRGRLAPLGAVLLLALGATILFHPPPEIAKVVKERTSKLLAPMTLRDSAKDRTKLQVRQSIALSGLVDAWSTGHKAYAITKPTSSQPSHLLVIADFTPSEPAVSGFPLEHEPTAITGLETTGQVFIALRSTPPCVISVLPTEKRIERSHSLGSVAKRLCVIRDGRLVALLDREVVTFTSTLEQTSSIPISDSHDIAVFENTVYVANNDGVTRFMASTRTPDRSHPLLTHLEGVKGLAVSSKHVWASIPSRRAVLGLDRLSMREVDRLELKGLLPGPLHVVGSYLWAPVEGDQTLRIGLDSNRTTANLEARQVIGLDLAIGSDKLLRFDVSNE